MFYKTNKISNKPIKNLKIIYPLTNNAYIFLKRIIVLKYIFKNSDRKLINKMEI